MSEYRYNLLTDRWVIIASKRNSRPHDFQCSNVKNLAAHDPECPFCPGNEKMTPPETCAVRPDGSLPDSPGWSVRVVPNKYPALTPESDSGSVPSGENCRSAAGFHEVLIESTHHHQSIPHHSPEHTGLILCTLRNRYNSFAKTDRIKHISVFYNHGRSSGASLLHPHFQIIALSSTPPNVISQLEHCRKYYLQHQKSPLASILEQEQAQTIRVISANKHFVALCPFASMCPFEVYFVPVNDISSPGQLTDTMIPDLAQLLQDTLLRLDNGLGDPDYNLVFHTAPVQDDAIGFRFYIQLYPRLATMGGFELSTDIFINTVSPENAAAFYAHRD